jgi:glucose/arabinose dehydrogenase
MAAVTLRVLVLALTVLVPSVRGEAMPGWSFSPPLREATAHVELELRLAELSMPVAVVPYDDDRLLVVQLQGEVVLIEDGQPVAIPFLALEERVTALDGEQGLLSIAVEPRERAAASGDRRHVVAAFTEVGSGDLVVAAYPLAPHGRWADPTDEIELLRIVMPEPFHHGGALAFAPDGTLFVGVGDGEVANVHLMRRPHTAQDLSSLRGKILRIDPRFGDGTYEVPADNPFVGIDVGPHGESVRPELWAYGLRNPWKLTVEATGALLAASVGNDRWESIFVIEAGGDHGWPAREGPECQSLPEEDVLVDPVCPWRQYVEPVVTYGHFALDPAGGLAVTGGHIVRDPDLPRLVGRYLFGDFVSGRLWSWDPEEERVELLLETGLSITAIDRGLRDEVLVVGIQGIVARVVERD